MKERPILFSASMVRAIIDGRKTQTRRVVKPQPYLDSMGNACWNGLNFGQDADGTPHFQQLASPLPSSKTKRVHCPFGAPGDRLWVRENFQPLLADNVDWHDANYKTGEGYLASYPATDGVQEFYDMANDNAFCSRVTPSIHMPRWASRITLEVIGVRVERLQSISEADADAEGADPILVPPDGGSRPYTEGFRSLWDRINGAESWGANPWVWVVAFRRVEQEEARR